MCQVTEPCELCGRGMRAYAPGPGEKANAVLPWCKLLDGKPVQDAQRLVCVRLLLKLWRVNRSSAVMSRLHGGVLPLLLISEQSGTIYEGVAANFLGLSSVRRF